MLFKFKAVPDSPHPTPQNTSCQVIEPLPPKGPTNPYYKDLENVFPDVNKAKEKNLKTKLMNAFIIHNA